LVLREAIRHFLGSSNQANDYFLIGFNSKPQLLADWTSEPAKIIDAIYGLRVYGNTALYDACYVGVDKLRGGRHSKRALILISDGLDNLSHYTFNELRDLLRETNVLLYSINFQRDLGQGMLAEDGGSILAELSSTSGGKSFSDMSDIDGAPLKPKHANEILEMIAIELRNQYTLFIVPNETPAAKKWHKIKVKVNVPRAAPPGMKGLSVRTRDGFYGR
jgi:Ca-activated chloride channel family protein